MMNFGSVVGTACSTFAIINVDDMFVLVTFFAETSTSNTLPPIKITIGQYIRFTVIIIISMICWCFVVLLSDPIGFLDLLSTLLRFWGLFDLLFSNVAEESEKATLGRINSLLEVSITTLMNGGDKIGTDIPPFSQTRGVEIWHMSSRIKYYAEYGFSFRLWL
jgi:cadmium resistance protein CadD (predicted permease)